MRSFALACAALLLACASLADDPPATKKPDYSRDALLRFVNSNEIKMSPLPERPAGRIQWHIGWFELHALGTQWRIFYLPIAVPLAGSGLNNVAKIPNALELNGTPFPASPQLSPDRSAAVHREMKRVLKLEREAELKAKP